MPHRIRNMRWGYPYRIKSLRNKQHAMWILKCRGDADTCDHRRQMPCFAIQLHDLPLARVELRKHFASEHLIRPEGTRAGSIEVFVVGLEKRA